MKDFIELAGISLIIIVFTLVMALAISTPFAFLGWVMTTIIGLFTTVTVTYFDMVAVGIGVAIVGGLSMQAKLK